MSKVSVAVMGVPERRSLRNRVIDRLGSLGGDAVPVVDYRHRGAVPTSLRAWASYDPSATHHLVLQDDSWPCDNFPVVLDRVLAAAPEAIVSLFTLQTDIKRHHAMGRHFVRNVQAHGVGFVMPTGWVKEYLRWSEERWVGQWHPGDDARLEFWSWDTGRPFLLTVPNIVDHRDDGKSWEGHRPGRRSPVYHEDIAEREEWVMPNPLVDLNSRIPVEYLDMYAAFHRGELWTGKPRPSGSVWESNPSPIDGH